MKIFLDASLLVYLIVPTPEIEEKIANFYTKLIEENELYTNVLVFDEAIFISKKKYKVSYGDSMVFIEENVLPYVKVLPIGLEDYLKAKNNIFRYSLKPSDAIHLGVIENNGLQAIATEDEDFDRVPIKRVWF